MNKRIIIKIFAIIALLGIIGSCNASFAYSKDGISIEIDPYYYEYEDGVWITSETASFTLKIEDNSKDIGVTKDALKEYINKIKIDYSDARISRAELTEINGYKCLYIEKATPGVSLAEYIIPTKDTVYIVTFSGESYDIDSDRSKVMLESLKIDNYEAPDSNELNIKEIDTSDLIDKEENIVVEQANENNVVQSNNTNGDGSKIWRSITIISGTVILGYIVTAVILKIKK